MPLRLDPSRTAAWTAVLLLAAGLIVASYACWAIVDWHRAASGSPPAGLERIQYDTAWAFAFAGAALMAHAIGLDRVGRLCAAVPIVLGALRLIAYIAPGTIRIHPILANPALPSGVGNYNDMGVLTALVFVVLSSALGSLRAVMRGPWRSVLIAMLASVALALTLLLLFGAWTGGTAASGLLLTGGERTNALLFLVLGSAVLGYALLGTEAEQHELRRWTPAIVWFAVFVSALVLWRALSVQEARYIQNSTGLVAADIRGQIERELAAHMQLLQRLADRSQIYGFTEDQWQQDAGALLRDVPEFQALAWASEDLAIRWVAPLPRPDSPVYDLRADPAQRLGIDSMVSTRRPALTRFVNLADGKKGFAILVPEYVGDSLRGMVVAALGSGHWLQSLLAHRFPEYEVALLEDGELIDAASADAAPVSAEWAQEQLLVVANARWTLRVTPKRAMVQKAASPLPELSLALGTLLATLLALCVYLFQMARQRARDLAITNAQLVDDVQARRLVEQALRGSEYRTRLIIDAIKDRAIYMLDTEGRVASWNPGAEALNGYTATEILGHHFSILYPPERTQRERELAVAARQGWYEEERWHQRKDGTRYCGDDSISPIRDDNGVLQGFSVITSDATQRIELRKQAERARDFFSALFSDFPNLVWRSDAAGSCDYLNQAWLDYTGRPLDAEIGHGWLEGMHPEDRQRWSETLQQGLSTQQPFELEFRLRRGNGEYGWMICSGRPYRDIQGGFSGFLCSCYDNTARRAIEDALKESEERYERITANVPGMVFRLRQAKEGKLAFVYVSHGCEALTGLKEATLARDAEAFFALIPGDDRPLLTATLEASARQLTTWSWGGRLYPKHDPTEKWVTIRAQPRPADSDGTLWDGVVFDDTQSRLAQLEVERSREELRALSRHLQSVREEEKARIAREVHDELGSTLTALRMDLDWLGEQLPGELAAVRQKREAMVKLVEAAVSATRKVVTDLRPSILDDLGLAAALRWQAGEFQKHTGAQVHVEADSSKLALDHARSLTLFRVFQETLTNVARHAKATEVWVQLSASNGAYVLQVRDNGVGMAATDLNKPASHGIRGMRERVRELGGDVSVTSKLGAGTSFVVSIPMGPPS